MKTDGGVLALTLVVLALVALLWNPGAEGATHHKGDHVLFSGQVTGADGEPVANVTVLLELSRTTFSLRRFKQVKPGKVDGGNARAGGANDHAVCGAPLDNANSLGQREQRR